MGYWLIIVCRISIKVINIILRVVIKHLNQPHGYRPICRAAHNNITPRKRVAYHFGIFLFELPSADEYTNCLLVSTRDWRVLFMRPITISV